MRGGCGDEGPERCLFQEKLVTCPSVKTCIFFAKLGNGSIQRNIFEKATMPPQCNCRKCKRHVKIPSKKTLYIHGLTYMHANLKSS